MKKKTLLFGFVVILVMVLILPVSAVSTPEADFVSNLTDGTAPFGVLFIDESSNTPTTWLWSFGDGSTSTLKNPTHTYKTAGTYSVTLTATNSAGSSTITQTGYITVSTTGSGPVAAFVTNVTSGTVPLSVLFVDSSTNSPSSYIWSFGDGGTSTAQNPVHTYASAGTYAVTLTVTNSVGSNTLSQSGYITVTKESATPVASFVATETSGSAPLVIQFVDSSTNSPTSWAWSFGDGSSSTSQNPDHIYTSVGTYTVTLTATNPAGSDTVTETDYITVELSAPITSFVADTTTGPAPLTVNFTDTSTNSPTEWYWVFGDGSTSTYQNVTHSYTSTGTYTVKLTAYNDAGSNKTTRSYYITVTETITPPTASFTSDVKQGNLPLTVQFTDTSGNSPTAWVWTFGDGNSSTLPNPSHTYTASGTYTVKLTATNAGGSNTQVRSGYITVTTTTSTSTYQTEVPSTTAPATDTLTPAPSDDATADSASGGSSGILPFAGIAVLVVIGILVLIFLKRPPQGPHHSGGREL
ncbi:PKD domain-containing protein [Methanoregula sp.]|uniref:PKD domain-containing protein n=1 Tax=Methanoregula sp. TaxID=2052170 RepID=UPI0035670EF6